MDKLEITGLNVKTQIGVHAWEQRITQCLTLDLSIPFDFTTCNNQLDNTLDYDKLCKFVTLLIESNAFVLIETVAEKVAQGIKDEFKVTQLTVSVSKPGAVKNAGNISVTITR